MSAKYVIGRNEYGNEIKVRVSKDDINAAITKARNKGAKGRIDLLVVSIKP